MNSAQLSLFDDIPPRSPTLKQQLKGAQWSYFKRSLLEKCPRAYYNQYFGANKRTAKQEPEKTYLHFLKNRVSIRYMVAGTALHTAIRAYLEAARSGGVWDTARLVGFSQYIYQKSWNYSREHPDGRYVPNEKYPPLLMKEYYCNWPDADDLCAEEEARLVEATRSFATNPLFKEFRLAGTRSSSLVEHRVKLERFPCRVDGRIDLAYQEHDLVKIVDWKLGQADGLGDNSIVIDVEWLVNSTG